MEREITKKRLVCWASDLKADRVLIKVHDAIRASNGREVATYVVQVIVVEIWNRSQRPALEQLQPEGSKDDGRTSNESV